MTSHPDASGATAPTWGLLFGRSIPIGSSGLGLTLQEPVGVVAAITPWNFPLVLTIWKVAPAHAAGCTMVVKPASQAPASILELGGDLLEAGLPPGVFNVITGPGSVVGEALVDHLGVDKVSFTGSKVTGRRVMELASASGMTISGDFPPNSSETRFRAMPPSNASSTPASNATFRAGSWWRALSPTRWLEPSSKRLRSSDSGRMTMRILVHSSTSSSSRQ